MQKPFTYANVPPADNHRTPAYWFAFTNNELLLYEKGTDVVPHRLDFNEVGLGFIRQHYLGDYDGNPCYAVDLAEPVTLPSGMALKNLRAAYPRLGEDFFTLAGRAVQIIDWDHTHQFCGRCGAKTIDAEEERAKRCPACGLSNYPRLSPSIIVRINRGAEILMARAFRFPPGMYSVLAGFVEPGETLEQAVEREVWEEVRIRVKNIRYFGSQPWPFPNSLMLGFTAEYAGGEIEIDQVEIEDAGWYSADNLPQLPPKLSIARRLIDDFVENYGD